MAQGYVTIIQHIISYYIKLYLNYIALPYTTLLPEFKGEIFKK